MQPTRGQTKKKFTLPLPAAIKCSYSLLKAGPQAHQYFHTDISSTRACTSLEFTISTSVNLHVLLPFCVWRTLFPGSHPSHLALGIFLLPLLQCSLSLGIRGPGRDIPHRFSIPQTLLLWDNEQLLQEEASSVNLGKSPNL